MFSVETSFKSSPARPPVPIAPMLSFSLDDNRRAARAGRTPMTSPAEVAAVPAMNFRRFSEAGISFRSGMLFARGREFTDVNVLEEQFVAVVLQFNLPGWIDRLFALPIIFENRVVHDQLIVQKHMHPLTGHDNAEAVP